MKETTFTGKFVGAMRKAFPHMYAIKIHGHEMQSAFIPDTLFSINGLFVGIEFKIRRDGRISIAPGQVKEINKIKNSNGIGLIVACDEGSGKILIREKRIDYRAIFLSTSNLSVKSKNIRIDWDFTFSNYDNAVDLIGVIVENH